MCFCLLGMVLLVSCREKGFLSLNEAVAFSNRAPLSAADAYARLEEQHAKLFHPKRPSSSSLP